MKLRKLTVFITFFAVFVLALSDASSAQQLWNTKKKKAETTAKKTEKTVNSQEGTSVDNASASCSAQDEKEIAAINKAFKEFLATPDLTSSKGKRMSDYFINKETIQKITQLQTRCPHLTLLDSK